MVTKDQLLNKSQESNAADVPKIIMLRTSTFESEHPNNYALNGKIEYKQVIEEIKQLIYLSLPLSFINVCENCTSIIILSFIGHLAVDADLKLNAIGLSKNYLNIVGESIIWGMVSALFTFVPQAIGKKRNDLLAYYFQQSLLILTLTCVLSSIALYFADRVLFYVVNNDDDSAKILSMISIYSKLLIIGLFLDGYLIIVQTICQSLNYQNYLLILLFVVALCVYPITYLFVDYLQLDYVGGAIAFNVVTFLQLLSCIIVLIIKKDFFYLIKPISISKLLRWKKIKKYLSLSIPGVIQNSLEWWMIEIYTVLSNYIDQSTISIASIVILSMVDLMITMVWVSLYMSCTIQIGKYVGLKSLYGLRNCIVAISIVFVAIFLTFTLIIIFLNRQLPLLFTNDEQIVQLSSLLLYILIAVEFGNGLNKTVGGISAGIGKQKISAAIVVVSYYVIGIPSVLLVLFYCDYRSDLYKGCIVIWSGLALSSCIAGILSSVYICNVNYEEIIRQSSLNNTIDVFSHKLSVVKFSIGANTRLQT